MTMETFLKIGAFARLCHTTKETLLHYDRQGLLKPKHISGNGYRRYSLKQYFEFDLICLLKETGSTLKEIKKYRDTCEHDGYLQLFRERVTVLKKEQQRIAHRLSTLTNFTAMGEEALVASYDTLFFEERRAEKVLAYPVDSDRIVDKESSVGCYSDCLVSSIMDGNATNPPFGVIIPQTYARNGVLKICYLFTDCLDNTASKHIMHMEEGQYACLFHRGSMQSHKQAFNRMMQELSGMGLTLCSHVYAYDHMNYVLAETGEDYIAKYVIRVERP